MRLIAIYHDTEYGMFENVLVVISKLRFTEIVE